MVASREVKTEKFLKDLNDDNPVTRWKAASSLRSVASDTEAMDALSVALEDENSFVRLNATQALRVGEKAARVLPNLIDALDDEDKYVRLSTLLTLQSIGVAAKNATPAIIQCLLDHEWEVRFFAAHLLGRLAPTNLRVRLALNKVLRDSVDLVQVAAREALSGHYNRRVG